MRQLSHLTTQSFAEAALVRSGGWRAIVEVGCLTHFTLRFRQHRPRREQRLPALVIGEAKAQSGREPASATEAELLPLSEFGKCPKVHVRAHLQVVLSTRFERRTQLSRPVSGNGKETITISLDYYYCQELDQGICKVGSVVFTVPLNIQDNGKPGPLVLKHKVD